MLIGIDGRPLAGLAAGCGRYVLELCKALDSTLPHAKFIVFSNAPINLPIKSKRWSIAKDNCSWGSKLPPFIWYMLRAGSLAQQYKVDSFWGGANFLPLRLPKEIQSVVTIHDLVYKVCPASMQFKHRLAYQLFFRSSLNNAKLVVANSRSTANRLASMGYRGADCIIQPSISSRFEPQARAIVEQAKENLGILHPYILCVSTLEPRKNLDSLLSAYVGMCLAGELKNIDLVLAGQLGWKNKKLSQVLTEAAKKVPSIRVLGYVADDLLPALYSGAKAVVMPSLYEGFGMPILEAKMCGARVVTTDIPELKEAGGDGPIYVLPTPSGIQAGIRKALASPAAVATPAPPLSHWQSGGRKLAEILTAKPNGADVR